MKDEKDEIIGTLDIAAWVNGVRRTVQLSVADSGTLHLIIPSEDVSIEIAPEHTGWIRHMYGDSTAES